MQVALTELAGDCQTPSRAADAVAHWLQHPNGKSGSRSLSSLAAEALEFKADCATPEEGQDVSQELEEQLEDQWLPGPASGRGPACSIVLDPDLQQGSVVRETESFEALSLSALQRRSEPSEATELTSLAEREPQVQTLQRLQSMLRKLQAKQLHHKPDSAGTAAKKCCGTWQAVTAE